MNIDITVYDSEATKVHNPWRYILSCIVIIMLYTTYNAYVPKNQTYMVIYICSVHVSTGKYPISSIKRRPRIVAATPWTAKIIAAALEESPHFRLEPTELPTPPAGLVAFSYWLAWIDRSYLLYRPPRLKKRSYDVAFKLKDVNCAKKSKNRFRKAVQHSIIT